MKQSIRTFALGILCATLLLGVTYYLTDASETANEISQAETITKLEQDGYVVSNTGTDYQNSNENPEMEQPSDQETSNQNGSEESFTYTLTIEAGMSPKEIIEKLYNANIIEDEQEFAQYLNENNYRTSIQIGEFEVSSDMTNEEVAETIANN